MNNRISAFGKHAARMLCLLAVGGLTWSCSDEFKLDDEKPDWLNSSIYESLQGGKFSTYLRLISDPEINQGLEVTLTDVLSRTGSKTVFVADDDAWNAFFERNKQLPATNPWHSATRYENLSLAQKKLLIYASQLDNAIVMENLASSDGSGTEPPTRGAYMRRYTDFSLTDTITFLPANEVPISYNNGKDADEKDYWGRFRDGKGIYMVCDSTRNMMLHFTTEYMAKQGISDQDFKAFMGRERKTRDVHIYDALLEKQDQVAENGYINVTEKVLTPLPNMAEAIRSYGRTRVFSHILDRFSFPYYNAAVTEAYQRLYPDFKDSIFTKKYFTELGAGAKAVKSDPYGASAPEGVFLKFDPGWNEFKRNSLTDPRTDMASMFVPSDETFFDYFSEGKEGWPLIKTYCDDPNATVNKNDYTALFKQIDQIPRAQLAQLLYVMMYPTFAGAVPSKMFTLRDDAMEEIFGTEGQTKIDTCIMANNGAVYVMNKVYGPADYTSVAAPANISKTNNVMRWAIYNGRETSKTDYMGLYYFSYLKAMKSKFFFFLPSDRAMKHYYDPVSFTVKTRERMIEMSYIDRDNVQFPISAIPYRYTPATGAIGTNISDQTVNQTEITNRLQDILESHTIVYDGTNDINGEDQYFIAKNGSAVKVTRDEATGDIIAVQGGFQLENERAGIVGGDGLDQVAVTKENTNVMQNGTTYILDDSPIIPPSKTVYGVLHEQEATLAEANPYHEFCELTEMGDGENVLVQCGLISPRLSDKARQNAINKYKTFIGTGAIDQNVQFFNNYRYTVLIPSNEAIKNAIANGLPTWESIVADFESCAPDPDSPEDLKKRKLTGADSLRLQAKINYLNNFIRGHFLDNCIFADKSEFKDSLISSSYNQDLGVFVKVDVKRVKEGSSTKMYVQDKSGGPQIAVTNLNNIMARDVIIQNSNTGAYENLGNFSSMNLVRIAGSSFAVVHLIDGVLNHTPLEADGKYPDFDNPSQAKAYLKKFAIR